MTRRMYKPRQTSPFVWFIAILCTVITIAVIITGLAVFIGYLVVQPKVPFIVVTYSHLDLFDYDQAGLLTTKVTLVIKWENHNARVHASFDDASFILSLEGLGIAKLIAEPFVVNKNSSLEFAYVVESSPIPLSPVLMDVVDMSLKRDSVRFDLKGSARTQWRLGAFGSIKSRLHLNCQLHFTISTSNSTHTYCSSKSR